MLPAVVTAPPTVFPTVFTPEESVFPTVPTPDPITFPVVDIVFDAAGLSALRVALNVLPVALNKFWPKFEFIPAGEIIPGTVNALDIGEGDGDIGEGDGDIGEGDEEGESAHCVPLQVLQGPVELQQVVHFGKTGGTI